VRNSRKTKNHHNIRKWKCGNGEFGLQQREWGKDNGWMWESGKMKENEGRVLFFLIKENWAIKALFGHLAQCI
jgi:hypothetical protein